MNQSDGLRIIGKVLSNVLFAMSASAFIRPLLLELGLRVSWFSLAGAIFGLWVVRMVVWQGKEASDAR